MDKTKVEMVRDLCRQLESLESQLLNLVGGRLIEEAPEPVKKRRGRKKGKSLYTIKVKAKGRPRKVRDYLCTDCRHSFKSNLALIDAQCPECGSVSIENGTLDGNVTEENN
jgi:predicted Zn-ribbon and HTH transcriptional regulator